MATTVFIVDAPDYVIMADKYTKGCIYPVYRFDNQYALAKAACEEIATIGNKLVMDVYNYCETAPWIYHPLTKKTKFNTDHEDYSTKLKHIIA